MSAIKKTSVAALIMLLCIVLAIVIGESRKNYYEDPTAYEETVGGDLFGMTTFGAITEDMANSFDMPPFSEGVEEKSSGLGAIVLVIIIIIVLRKLSRR